MFDVDLVHSSKTSFSINLVICPEEARTIRDESFTVEILFEMKKLEQKWYFHTITNLFFYIVVSPHFAIVPGQHQSQPVLVPATPAQVTLVQQPQPMNATAGSVGNPAASTAPTANGATVTDEKSEKPSETSKPQDEPPNISYGQTASEQFHDQRNLLETV